MRLNKTKNTKVNIVFGSLYQVISIILPFVQRVIIIRTLGELYLGLNSLFSSILGMLSLAELGFSTALVYSMYKPIAENNTKKICAILSYYRRVYTIIGTVITACGLAIAPFLRLLIKGDYPSDINIYIVYILTLLNVSSSYFFFAYKIAIITAYQRIDIRSKVMSVVVVIRSIAQIIVLLLFKNYYLYIIILPISTIASNVIIAKITDKFFPDLLPKGIISKEEKIAIGNNVKSLFIYKIGTVVAGSVDNLVISSFIGLSALALYNNYYTIIIALSTALNIIYSSLVGGFGNNIASYNKEVNLELFNKMFWIQSIIIGWMSTCLISLFQPFIRIVYGTEFCLPFGLVICIVLLFYTWKINDMNHIFKEAAGLWKYDRFRPLIASIVNMSVNITLVHFIGLYGIVISSLLIEMTISLFWGCRIIYKHYFLCSFKHYLMRYIKQSAINLLIIVVTFYVSDLVNADNYFTFFIRCVICVVIPTVLYFILYYLLGYREYLAFLIGKFFPRLTTKLHLEK